MIYKMVAPACISFSGGRSSAYLLKKTLDAHGGKLPLGTHAIFANTGKEHPGTLDFVRECEIKWSVPIVWLEYDGGNGKYDYAEVTYATAARNGEPYEKLIEIKKALPNWSARWCTEILKVRRIRAYMRTRYFSWYDHIGIRADEPLRVARIKGRAADDEVTCLMPLNDIGVTVENVRDFWRAQSFDLKIPDGAGNCTLCFLKGVKILRREISRDPAAADWWIEQERKTGRTFSSKWTYAHIRDTASTPPDKLAGHRRALALYDEPTPDCACTD